MFIQSYLIWLEETRLVKLPVEKLNHMTKKIIKVISCFLKSELQCIEKCTIFSPVLNIANSETCVIL